MAGILLAAVTSAGGAEASSPPRTPAAEAAGSVVRGPSVGAGGDAAEEWVIHYGGPWWRGWPAVVFGLLATAVAAYGVLAWRTRLLAARNLLLEHVVDVRTAQLRRANDFKDELIARLNHEIRNPMNGLVGVASMIEARARDSREEMLAEMLRSCTEQLRATLDDVLDLSRVDEARFAVVEERFELVELVRNTCRRFEMEDGVVRLVEPLPGPHWCRGDQGKIRLVLSNYLSNARKYGSPPRAEVRLEAKPLGASGIRARLSVENPGPTLAPDELAGLFHRLGRGRRADDTGVEGTGLGLVFCRRYAEAMGGAVGAASEGGRTTFWLEVPLAVMPAHEVAARQRLASDLRALAIEDERYNRFVLAHYLKELGLRVDWATNFSDAIVLALANPPDVILTDWSLPDMTGAEALAKLRSRLGPAMPPVVVISAHATVQVRTQIREAGAQEFLSKPVTLDRLHAVLARLNLMSRPPFLLGPPPAGLDFTRLLAAGPAAEVLPRFVSDLREGFEAVREAAGSERAAAGPRLHALRCLALLVGGAELARLLTELEAIVPENRAPAREGELFRQVGAAVARLAGEAERRLSAGAPPMARADRA